MNDATAVERHSVVPLKAHRKLTRQHESQMKAAAAQSAGRLTDEIVPVITPAGQVVDRDTCLRPQTTLARPIHERGHLGVDGGG